MQSGGGGVQAVDNAKVRPPLSVCGGTVVMLNTGVNDGFIHGE